MPVTGRTHLELLLFSAFFWVDESLQKALDAKGFPRLNRTQSMLMLAIESGTKRPSHLAKQLGVSRQAVGQQLNELASLDLVELVADPADGRAKIVRFSPNGRPIVRFALTTLKSIEKEIEFRIGIESATMLRKALELDWGEPLNPAD